LARGLTATQTTFAVCRVQRTLDRLRHLRAAIPFGRGYRLHIMRMFADRTAAGRDLGRMLAEAGIEGDILVLGLPRGGIPVACEVAAALDAPVDALIVRKLGAPFNPELALGAIAYGSVTVYNDDLLEQLELDEKDLDAIRARELEELERRERKYRAGRPPPALAGRTVVIVDDGMATGATMHAAVVATRALAPARIIVAVPTAAMDAVERLERVADRVMALATPEPYFGVGAWYERFPQLTDEEVVEELAAYSQRVSAPT
jgi:predicted phosphoribosyltransferase